MQEHSIDNKPAFVQVMTWCRTGAKPLPEPMKTQFTEAHVHHPVSMDKQLHKWLSQSMMTSLNGNIFCMQWKHFPHYWPFVQGIHWLLVNSPHKGQWRGALMFSSICAWIIGWVNNREAGDLGCHHAHYDVTVMSNIKPNWSINQPKGDCSRQEKTGYIATKDEDHYISTSAVNSELMCPEQCHFWLWQS